MADIVSREAALIASASARKMKAASSGEVRASAITSPAVAAWAQNDTCGNRDIIPAGSRILGALVSNAALGASVTLSVGLRAWNESGTGAVVDAAAVVSALSVASAQSSLATSGTYVAAGVDQVTTAATEPYFTLAGADPTDNAQVSVKVLYVAA